MGLVWEHEYIHTCRYYYWNCYNDYTDFNLDNARKSALQSLHTVRPDAVLLSDYDKGMLTAEFIREVIDLCARSGVWCVADAKHKSSIYVGAIIKGNLEWYLRN